MVIQTDFWMILTGNFLLGIVVNHRRNSSLRSDVKCSHIFSNSGIHEIERWQLDKITQQPLDYASLTILEALGPYPCPNEILKNFYSMPISFENLLKLEKGSQPDDSTKINGVCGVESLKH